MGGVEAVALHEAYDRQGVLQGNFLVTIVGSVIALLEACEEQGFDLADFFPAILPGQIRGSGPAAELASAGISTHRRSWCVVIPECRRNAWSRQRGEAR